MSWEQAFIEAIQDNSIVKVKDVFKSLCTEHAHTPKQADKTKAIQLIKSYYKDADIQLYEFARNLANALDDTCEEISLIIIAEKYHINPREATQIIYRLSDSPNWEVREWAASACSIVLINHFDAFHIELMKWVHDESPNIRRCVAVAVKYVSKAKKIAFFAGLVQLVQPLLYDKDPYVIKNLGAFAIGDGLLKNYVHSMIPILNDWIRIDNEYVRSNIALIFTSAAAAKHYEPLEDIYTVLRVDKRTVVVKAVNQAERNLKKRLPQFMSPPLANIDVGGVLMKNVISIIIIMFILVGCESEEVPTDKGTSNLSEAIIVNDTNELLAAKKRATEIENANQKLNDRIVEMEEQLEFYVSKYSRIEHIIEKVTRLEKFEFEIIQERTARPSNETIVYVVDVPDRLDEQEIYVIRAAIQFANNNFTKVSLWKDRQTAMKYMNNDYDPEDGFDGWSGFNQIFGFIDNTSMPPKLTFKSGHDEQVIEFGKYTYEK